MHENNFYDLKSIAVVEKKRYLLQKGVRTAEKRVLRGFERKIMRENNLYGLKNIVAVEKIT